MYQAPSAFQLSQAGASSLAAGALASHATEAMEPGQYATALAVDAAQDSYVRCDPQFGNADGPWNPPPPPGGDGSSSSGNNGSRGNSRKPSLWGHIIDFARTGRWHNPRVELSAQPPAEGAPALETTEASYDPNPEWSPWDEGKSGNAPLNLRRQEELLSGVHKYPVRIVTSFDDLLNFRDWNAWTGMNYFIVRRPDGSGRLYATRARVFGGFKGDEIVYSGGLSITPCLNVHDIQIRSAYSASGGMGKAITNGAIDFIQNLLGPDIKRGVKVRDVPRMCRLLNIQEQEKLLSNANGCPVRMIGNWDDLTSLRPDGRGTDHPDFNVNVAIVRRQDRSIRAYASPFCVVGGQGNAYPKINQVFEGDSIVYRSGMSILPDERTIIIATASSIKDDSKRRDPDDMQTVMEFMQDVLSDDGVKVELGMEAIVRGRSEDLAASYANGGDKR